jgi:hypothetical protein
MDEEEHTKLTGAETQPAPESSAAPEPAVVPAGVEEPRAPARSGPDVAAREAKIYRGNLWDVTALIVALVGVLPILTIGTLYVAARVSCVPLLVALPLLVLPGILGLAGAHRALEPRRTRILVAIGLAAGLLELALLAKVILDLLVWSG